MTASSEVGQTARRGAAPVGRMLELSPLEMQFVIYVRLWCIGSWGQIEVLRDLDARLGLADGRTALLAFERFLQAVTDAARRPLQRHGVECPCLGGDEAALAMIVALAASGEREDAELMLACLAPAAAAPELARLAEDAALKLAGSCLPPRVAASRPDVRPGGGLRGARRSH